MLDGRDLYPERLKEKSLYLTSDREQTRRPQEVPMEERLAVGDVVSYNGLTFHIVDVAGTVIGISTIPNPGTTARVMWVSPTRVKKFQR